MKNRVWHNSPEKLTLLPNEIHIWRANLDLPATQIKNLASILSEDEKIRANRFRFEQHRDRFIVGRGRLRQLLGNYLQIKSEQVIFAYSDRGKPSIISSLNKRSLQFNLSHSQNLALYAFNYQRIIGVDLEYIKDNIEYKQLAQRFFSPQELQLINSYPERTQKTIFFQLWTAKEAYLKATGDGLAGSLDQIEFTLNNNSELNLVATEQAQLPSSHWLIDNFIPQDNFIATVAIKNNSSISDSISTKFFEF
ncbi:MAG: 4'-phosphopantetheinyl transferase superfamily protein [Cyanobacteria bacterium P01_F01_bin.143]